MQADIRGAHASNGSAAASRTTVAAMTPAISLCAVVVGRSPSQKKHASGFEQPVVAG